MKILRNILGGAAVLAIIGAGFMVQRWHDKANQYDAAIEQRDQLRADFVAYRVSIEQRDLASEGYQHEIAGLRAEFNRRPVPVVRVCPPTPASVPAAETATAGPEPAAPAGGVVHGSTGQAAEPAPQPGPDIGPGLYALAQRADILSAQVRAILAYMENKSDGH